MLAQLKYIHYATLQPKPPQDFYNNYAALETARWDKSIIDQENFTFTNIIYINHLIAIVQNK